MKKPTKWHVRPAKTQISEDSDWADAQADFSLGAQSFCWFCHEAAHIIMFWVVSLLFVFHIFHGYVEAT